MPVPDDAGSTPPSATSFFATRVEPMLLARCGGCHGADRSGPDFLRPNPDVRTTLLAYPALVNLEAPRSSRLLTKGEHAGPAFTDAEALLVLMWIELEAAERSGEPTERELATAAEPVREGFNALSLDALGVPGTSIHFVAARAGRGMFFDDVRISAGPMGVHIEHPVFVVWIEGVPHPDPVDRFAGFELDVEPNSSRPFEPGQVALTEFPEGALLSIHFDDVTPLRGGSSPGADGGMPGPDAGMPGPDAGMTGGTGDGCRQLAAFRTMASPQLVTYCTRCHGGGNATATAALDMRNVQAMDDATLWLGCNQILGRIPPASPSTSGLFVQPDPASGGSHPFTFGTAIELNTFRSRILQWFEMETMP
jgi:cytochrome c553